MNSLKDFIKGLYEDSDKQMKDIYNQQENDKKSIFDKIGSILLNYTIIDNLLNLTLGQKNSLYDSMSNLIIQLFSKETTETKNVVTDVLKSTIKKSAKYYDLEFKVGLNKNTKVTSNLVNKDAEKFIKKKYKGENFSKRIWKNNNEVSKEVQNEIEKLLKGKTSVNDIKKIIENEFETNKFNAKRLVESEVSRVHDEIFKKYCRDNGINKVIYKATFCHTCDFCKKDHNKLFDLDEAPQLPRHPQCRCYYTYDIDNIDYMSNRFVPRFKESKVDMLGKKINKKKVTNSKFDMWTDINSTPKNKAIRLYEKKIRSIQSQMPNDFKMPRFIIMDFENNGINPKAIGGYSKDEDTLYLNSKYDTNEKIEKFLKTNEGYFANIDSYSVLLHELGHKYHYYLAEKIAENKNISYNKAKEEFDDGLADFINNSSNFNNDIIKKYISEYAFNNYRGPNRMNEVMAEFFAIKNSDNELINFIRDYIKGVVK